MCLYQVHAIQEPILRRAYAVYRASFGLPALSDAASATSSQGAAPAPLKAKQLQAPQSIAAKRPMSPQRPPAPPQPPGAARKRARKPEACYVCGAVGHKAADCPQKASPAST